MQKFQLVLGQHLSGYQRTFTQRQEKSEKVGENGGS